MVAAGLAINLKDGPAPLIWTRLDALLANQDNMLCRTVTRRKVPH
ncbi:hypothetical protein GA0061099_101545 [Bradyrhizobium yuanmingense]|uniref:Uncharacterized protein n=1 Tax=Bradyrhizobium yuanmingense TaxID=108015 RepID=A0A1C3XFY6_9BRAD|nr:hypothetical protein IQ15_06917 [Bradyrhizobium yuanmingense]SCB51181.1 hypothetical protein GA0061099_101545 [Bradyrhizobium yuanmingense]